MPQLKEKYLKFIEKERKNAIEKIIYFFLFLLSFVYGAIVTCRNFLYNTGVFRAHGCKAKVISVGNLSWGGTGKTTLASFLCQKLTPERKVAVLRRGYGTDEQKLLEGNNVEVFQSKNRVKLANKLCDKFNLFILDDGFQYRKLNRNVNIALTTGKELSKKWRLIPAGSFREPFGSLKRADILVINHKNALNDLKETIEKLNSKFRNLSIYTAEYVFKKITDMKNHEIDLNQLKNRKLAALTAIGYPQGFFNVLAESGIKTLKQTAFPDHHNFSIEEFNCIQENFIKEGIFDVIITGKDKYHIPEVDTKINVYIFEIELKISQEEKFINEIKNKLK